MITEQVPDTSEMYDDGMVIDIKRSMAGVSFPGTEDFLEWLFRQMVDRGVNEMWINHSIRVGEYAARVAKEFLCELDIPGNDVRLVRTGGIVHDIGNILGFVGQDKHGNFRSVNMKPATSMELEQLKLHPEIGRRYLGMLDPDGRIGINTSYISDMIRSHHENLNRSGYPRGLGDKEIPAAAKLIRIPDMIDAASDPDHPHKGINSVLSFEEIKGELRANAGKLYDTSMAAEFFMTLLDGRTREYLKSRPGEKYFRPSFAML